MRLRWQACSTTCIKQTIFKTSRTTSIATSASRVFVDNAGIITLRRRETASASRSRPTTIPPPSSRTAGRAPDSAGCIRDILGTGLGARARSPTPTSSASVIIDVADDAQCRRRAASTPRASCVASSARRARLRQPHGHPDGRTGACLLRPRYTGNPLVYAGTVGLIPRRPHARRRPRCPATIDRGARRPDRTRRHPRRDLLEHGAARGEPRPSRAAAPCRSATRSPRRRRWTSCCRRATKGLFTGTSPTAARVASLRAVGEMGEKAWASEVDVSTNAPLKYEGPRATFEIWISEAQERMVIAVPPEQLDELLVLAASEDVECCVLGEFTDTKRLELLHSGAPVGELDMGFLHDGTPRPLRRASWSPPEHADPALRPARTSARRCWRCWARRTSRAESGSCGSTTTRCRRARS